MNMVNFNVDLNKVDHHPALEQIVTTLCERVQNEDKGFFRVEVAYFMAKMASSMRATILTKDRGEVPVNLYAIALATSGYGKGHSIGIMENEILGGFKKLFLEQTFPTIAEDWMWKLAIDRAALNGTEEDDEKEKLDKEFDRLGPFVFTFDSGTSPATKDLRQKLLLANNGSINLQIDEIGSNLLGNAEVLNVFLELYDQGMTKQKLIKNTKDNPRGSQIDGKTPANMLLFGTPFKLLDGGSVEDEFFSFLGTGFSRRCLFAYGSHKRKEDNLDPKEMYFNLIKSAKSPIFTKWSNQFTNLADASKYGWQMTVEDDVGIMLLTYKLHCEEIADSLPDHKELRKAELSHRYFKVLKLAGAYAFVDESSEILMEHLLSAMKLVEETGESYEQILTRERSYMRLARFLAAEDIEQTHADLTEQLPFYKSTTAARSQMMADAMAWGYKQHIVIKKRFESGIEFFSGETLEKTDLNNLILSYSDHFAYNYNPDTAPFDKLHLLTQAKDMHWCNHHFLKNHRSEENVIPGFNTIVVDVDGGTSIQTATELMKDYKFMLYTTKRHDPDQHRFRMIFPTNYMLELDQDEYKEFINAFLKWMPFKSDEATNQRAKKWQSFDGGTYQYNVEGELLDVLKFIPKTSKSEEFQKEFTKLESLDNLQRWFAQRITNGNRNNELLKYALALMSDGMSFQDVEQNTLSFNKSLSNPLPEDEVQSTILRTVAKKMTP